MLCYVLKMSLSCLVYPSHIYKKWSEFCGKYKYLSIVLIGIFVYLLSKIYLQKLFLLLKFNSENIRQRHRTEDLWTSSPDDLIPPSPPGPWLYAGRWMGDVIDSNLHNSTVQRPLSDDVRLFTEYPVRYPDAPNTSPRFSTYRWINDSPKTHPQVGDILQLLIESRDDKGNPQVFGGDIWKGVLSDSSRKAYTAGRVTDYNNGTYLMTFVLSWSGDTRVEVTLVYPSRVTNWMRTRFRKDDHAPIWQGIFKRGNETKISNCYLTYGRRIPTNVCEYKNYHALTHIKFFCKKPAGFRCGHLVGHRNILSFGQVITKIIKADQMDIFKGIERYKTIKGQPVTLNVHPNTIQSSAISRLRLPTCGADLPISVSDGYWLNGTWTSLVCKNPDFIIAYTPSMIRKCFKNYNVHLTGDSTMRQWFFSITNALNVSIPGGNDKTIMRYRYDDLDVAAESNFNLTFTFHPLTYQMSFVVNISQMRFETDVLLNLPRHTCNHVVVVSPWTHFMTWPWVAYVEWLTNIKRALIEARRRCPKLKLVIKSPHALENPSTSRGEMMGVDVLVGDMKSKMRDIFEGSSVLFVDTWDMNQVYPEPNEMHMPSEIVNQEISLFLSYICPPKKRGRPT